MTKRRSYSLTLKKMVEKGIINPFDEIYHFKDMRTHKKREPMFVGKITPNGKILLDNNKQYKTPSGAAKYYTKKEVNGWIWWYFKSKNDKNIQLGELRKKYEK